MVLFTLCATFLCTFVLPLSLFLAAVKLWDIYCISGRDRSCGSPLPPGTMGLPFLGETLQLVLQRYKFLKMKVRKYGHIYKTHLFGSPTVRIMGAENVKQILLGEHKLVAVQWPASVRTILGAGCLSSLHDSEHKQRKRVILKAFSREALENYMPVMGEEIRGGLRRWLENGSCVLVYPEMKRLMFGIATRILLGFEPSQTNPRTQHELIEAFEEMIRNLFSLPIDVPFSGLYRGLKARNVIHAKIEENIRKKVARREAAGQFKDALQLLIEHSEQSDQPLQLQVRMQPSATALPGTNPPVQPVASPSGRCPASTLPDSPPTAAFAQHIPAQRQHKPQPPGLRSQPNAPARFSEDPPLSQSHRGSPSPQTQPGRPTPPHPLLQSVPPPPHPADPFPQLNPQRCENCEDNFSRSDHTQPTDCDSSVLTCKLCH